MIQALARVSSSHFAELLVLADPEVSKAIYRQREDLDLGYTLRRQMDFCWLCPQALEQQLHRWCANYGRVGRVGQV
jgi:hypothetical protein